MGAYNVVTIQHAAACPRCGDTTARVQFKYGDCWQLEYALGDRIRWGGNDVGMPQPGQVTVMGYGEECPRCGMDAERNFAVTLQSDTVIDVHEAGPEEWGDLLRVEAQRGW